MQKANDFILRTRIESACDLIAEENLGLTGQFHREREPPPLTAREDLHTLFAEFLHADFFEKLIHGGGPLILIRRAHPQPQRKIHALAHREFLVRDAELWDIRDFAWEKIIRLEVASLPENRTLLVAVGDASHEFEQSGFPATRRPDDCPEVAEGKTRRDIGKKSALALG